MVNILSRKLDDEKIIEFKKWWKEQTPQEKIKFKEVCRKAGIKDVSTKLAEISEKSIVGMRMTRLNKLYKDYNERKITHEDFEKKKEHIKEVYK